MLGELIRKTIEYKGLLMSQLSAKIEVDIAQISRFEKEERGPTREQVLRLVDVLELDQEKTLSFWLVGKIVQDIRDENTALKALKSAEKNIKKLSKNVERQ